jgi:hypothetical protein
MPIPQAIDPELVAAAAALQRRRHAPHRPARRNYLVLVSTLLLLASTAGAGLWIQHDRKQEQAVTDVLARARSLGIAGQWDAARESLAAAAIAHPRGAGRFETFQQDLHRSQYAATLSRAEAAALRSDFAEADSILRAAAVLDPHGSAGRAVQQKLWDKATVAAERLLQHSQLLAAERRWDDAESRIVEADRVRQDARLPAGKLDFDPAARVQAIRDAKAAEWEAVSDAIIASIEQDNPGEARDRIARAEKLLPKRAAELRALEERVARLEDRLGDRDRERDAADAKVLRLAERAMEITNSARSYPWATVGLCRVVARDVVGAAAEAWLEARSEEARAAVSAAAEEQAAEAIFAELDGVDAPALLILDAVGRLVVLHDIALDTELEQRSSVVEKAVRAVADSCPRCLGAGVASCFGCGGKPRKEVRVPCPGCKGVLRVDCPTCVDKMMKCRSCGGDGETSRWVKDRVEGPFIRKREATKACVPCLWSGKVRCSHPDCDREAMIPCKQCEKTGTVPWFELCRDCKGTSKPVPCEPCGATGQRPAAP